RILATICLTVPLVLRRFAVVFAMVPAVVGVSAAAEAGVAAESAGVASGAAGVLVPAPMALDADSARFSALVAAAGQQHVAMGVQHAAQRGLYAGAQLSAMLDAVATEALRAAAAAI
ncbi:hypothetical protein, partial [Candidatus Mycobacterium methanotrophicum]|uniref:hypothetical protein n=1 Tax=Candidatus Mycobacterium methanotrophicum TaxID=2943498 RepID=UPI001C570292